MSRPVISPRPPALPENSRAPTVSEALKRSARQIVLLSVFIVVATFAALSIIAPRYASEADIAIVAKDAAAGSAGVMDPAATSAYVRALQSPSLLQGVAENLALGKSREFNSALGSVDLFDAALRSVGVGAPQSGESESHRVLTALRNNLDVHVTGNGRAIAVRVISVEPARAAQIANAIAGAYAKVLSQETQIEKMAPSKPLAVNSAKTKSAAHPPLAARILSPAQPAVVPVFPKKVELAALAAIASLLFGAAWVVLTTALRGIPSRKAAKRQPDAETQTGPLLSEAPVLTDMHEAEVTVCSKATETTDSPPESARIAAPAAEAPTRPNTFTEMEALASRLKAKRPSGGGHRALITSDTASVVPFEEALELVKVLAGYGAQTILIDWSPRGEGIARTIGLESQAGWNDLLSGSTRFDTIIHRLPGTHAQVIAGGRAQRNGYEIDADLLNLALDALDEVYDHIVVTGSNDEARALFECIEGRFDAAITVVPDGEEARIASDTNIFLGFEVADIDVLRYRQSEPTNSAMSPMAQRIALATRPREAMSQRA